MFRMKTIVGAVLLLSVACGKSSSSSSGGGGSSKVSGRADAAPPPAKPITLDWSERYGSQEFKVQGGGGEGEARGFESSVRFRLEKFHKGATYEAGDKKGVIEDEFTVLMDVDVRDKLGDVAWNDLEKVDHGLVLKLWLPDGRQGEVPVPKVSFKLAIDDVLKKVENGPVTFGTEPEDPKPMDSLVYTYGSSPKLFGKAGKLNEIDMVATQEMLEEEKGRKTCKGYKDNAGKPAPDVVLVLKETKVTIWNRRTGDVVEEKVFAPDNDCPMFTFTSGDSNEKDSYPPTRKIEAWLKGKVKR